MLFSRKPWLFVILACLGAAFIGLEVFSIISLQVLVIEEYRGETTLLTVALSGILIIMTVVFVMWIQKYVYFWRLRRLLTEHVSKKIEYLTPLGVQYELSGYAPFFTINETQPGSNTTISYGVSDAGVWATSKTTTTTVRLEEAYFGEHETVHTTPVGIDQRKTFKHLIRVVESALPA
jgi:hypothetical protein